MKEFNLELKLTTKSETEDFVSIISKLMNIITTSNLNYEDLRIKGIYEETR